MDRRILDCIYDAVDEANEDSPDQPPLEKARDTQIYGSADGLDSLALINFVVAVEENVERAFDTSIMLGDDRALAADPSPFRTLGTLAEYVELLLTEDVEAAPVAADTDTR